MTAKALAFSKPISRGQGASDAITATHSEGHSVSSSAGDSLTFRESQLPDAHQYAFLFSDLVDSTGLKSQLNAWRYVRDVLDPHDRMFRELLGEYPQAHEIKQLGDGFLAIFSDVRDAVCFALRFHEALRQYNWRLDNPNQKVQTRIGIDVGFAVAKFDDGIPVDVFGPNVDVASRVMSAADGERTLLTATAFDIATQAESFINLNLRRARITPNEVVLTRHGAYRIQGIEQPVVLCEAALQGTPPLPPASRPPKVINLADQDWQPESATGELNTRPIPDRPGWKLVRKLGEGSFGRAYLAIDSNDDTNCRVFKFCRSLEKLEAFRTELELLRRIKSLKRPDIVEYYGAHLDRPPYYLELEYVEGGSLLEWSIAQGGLGRIPFQQRMDLFVKIAHAVASANREGIFHLDLMPSNILIDRDSDGGWIPKLTDFGMGANAVDDGSVSTYQPLSVPRSSASGSERHIYCAPETAEATTSQNLAGAAALHACDVYSLGVILFQLAAGDLQRPLSPSAIKTIRPRLLREDIEDATHFDPTSRIRVAGELEHRIRQLPRRARRQFLLSSFVPSVVMLFLVLVFLSTLLVKYVDLYDDAADAHAAAERYNREKLFAMSGLWRDVELNDISDVALDAQFPIGAQQLRLQQEIRKWLLEQSQRDLAALKLDLGRLDDQLAFARMSLQISELLGESDNTERARQLDEARRVLNSIPSPDSNRPEVQLLLSDLEQGLGQLAYHQNDLEQSLAHLSTSLALRTDLLERSQRKTEKLPLPEREYQRRVLSTIHNLGTVRWVLASREPAFQTGQSTEASRQAEGELSQALQGRVKLAQTVTPESATLYRDAGSSWLAQAQREQELARVASDPAQAGPLLIQAQEHLQSALHFFRRSQDIQAKRGTADPLTVQRMVDTLRSVVQLDLEDGKLDSAVAAQREMAHQIVRVLPAGMRDLNGLVYLTAAKVALQDYQQHKHPEDLQAARTELRLAENVFQMLVQLDPEHSHHWGDLGMIQADLGELQFSTGDAAERDAGAQMLRNALQSWEQFQAREPREYQRLYAARARQIQSLLADKPAPAEPATPAPRP